jgi:hypothetical protein
MDLYLPIAGMSVNALVIIALGGVVGLLTGMVGVGGGFLTTPILIFYGIPPAVAVASATTQITGTSISGVLAYRRRGGVDYRMGGVIIAGGMIGAVAGGSCSACSSGWADRYGGADPLRRAAGQHRAADGQGSRNGARHPAQARERQAAAPAQPIVARCRSGGASIARGSTSPRSRPSCSACFPAC